MKLISQPEQRLGIVEKTYLIESEADLALVKEQFPFKAPPVVGDAFSVYDFPRVKAPSCAQVVAMIEKNTFTIDGKPMFDGAVLFELKATHGFPLDFSLDRIINQGGCSVDWAALLTQHDATNGGISRLTRCCKRDC